ncbi:hypothetical protein ACTWQB_13485 [Piscibacillus sp. B03]|uniref:hypothetical protein n=1 Tax=Piscibacillus sp. B03 TaxID=3457430 RepID=UPI003FCC6FB0
MARIFILGFLILLITGCSWLQASIDLSEQDYEAIDQYLQQELKPDLGEDVFTAFEVLASSEEASEVYVWALIEGYSGSQVGSGMSIPLVLEVTHDDDVITVTNHKGPHDGSYYTSDIKEMFPKNTHNKIFDYPSNHIHNLKQEIEQKR